MRTVCDGEGKPLILLLTEGQVSDCRGAATVLPDLPDAKVLIADKALTDLEITPCIPGQANRKAPISYDADLYKQRNRIERMFDRLKGLCGCRPFCKSICLVLRWRSSACLCQA